MRGPQAVCRLAPLSTISSLLLWPAAGGTGTTTCRQLQQMAREYVKAFDHPEPHLLDFARLMQTGAGTHWPRSR